MSWPKNNLSLRAFALDCQKLEVFAFFQARFFEFYTGLISESIQFSILSKLTS
jgi:hypothetical protein